MKTSLNPYMLFHTLYLNDIEKAANPVRLRPYREPHQRTRFGDAMRALSVVGAAVVLVAVALPWMV